MKKRIITLLFCLNIPLLNGYDEVTLQGADLQTYKDIDGLSFERDSVNVNSGITKYLSELFGNEISIEEEVSNKYSIMYVTSNVNIRTEPNMSADVLGVLQFNTEITAYYEGSEWTKIVYGEKSGWVNSNYISVTPCQYIDYDIPSNKGFKSFMSYKTITDRKSEQYKIQATYAYTGRYGIRQINNRYCVALGTAFNASIGTYFDLILENGTTIPCIIGDIKADIHTKADNITTASNGCVSEFIVDIKSLYKTAKRDGNISSCRKEWESPVVKVRIYEKHI